jgi:TRAP-type transport system periplasmic protein
MGSTERETMIRRLIVASVLAAFAFATVGMGPEPVDAQEGTTVRLATLDRVTGPWERPLSAWRTQVARDTQGALRLTYDERGGDPVARMRRGEIDGAFLSVVSLGEIDRSLLVLNAPGVINDYEALDRVRRRIDDRFARILDAQGYKLLGWFDLGRIRLFATRPIAAPSDLRNAHPWTLPEDQVFSEFLRVVGATPVPLPIDRVKAALPRRIDVAPASALAAYGLEWYPQLPYVSSEGRGVVVGMTVVRKDRFEALTAAQQETLVSTSARVHALVRSRMREQDETLLRTILSRPGAQTFDMGANGAAWREAAEQARGRLEGRVFPASLLRIMTRAAAP